MSVELLKHSDKYLLSDLFPRKMDEPRVGKALIDRLVEYQLVLNNALESSKKLIAGDFERFDGIVGESACQIRAIKIALIAHKNLINQKDFHDRVSKAKSNIDSVLAYEQRKEIQKNKQSLRQVINSKELDAPITPEELFVIQCYILAEASEIVTQKENNVEYMTSLPRKLDNSYPKRILPPQSQISAHFAHDLVVKLKTMVAESSVNFVQGLGIKIQNKSLIQMLSKKIILNSHNAHLPCIPSFFGMKALLLTAQREKLPMIVRIKFLDKESSEKYVVTARKSLFFQTSEKANGSYVVSEPSKEDLEKPAFVVEGCAVCSEDDWNIINKDYTITDAILSFVAAHSQYPGNHKELEEFDNPELSMYKKMAEKFGFSTDNPKTFFIQHIYPARPNSQEFS